MNGEKQGVRATIDKLTRQAIEQGADPEWARRKAREAALRWDRREREK